MVKVKLMLPEFDKKDINVMIPSVPQIGSKFVFNYEFYKVYDVVYEMTEKNTIGQISIYLQK